MNMRKIQNWKRCESGRFVLLWNFGEVCEGCLTCVYIISNIRMKLNSIKAVTLIVILQSVFSEMLRRLLKLQVGKHLKRNISIL